MPAPYEPKSGDGGILWGGTMIPTTPPLAYVPCKGEIGLNNGGVFLPLEPACNTAKSDDFPQIVITQPFDGEPPFIDQVGMVVATPCIAPYDWSKAVASRTMILDTTPDAIATPEEKAVPGYVANPGLTLSSKTMEDFDTETTVAAIHLEAGKTYRILTVGDTDFVTEFGASANTVGVEFVASVNGGAGSGTGTTTHLAGKYNDKDGVAFRYTFLPTAAPIAAGSFVVGDTYTITVLGNTNWYAAGGISPAAVGSIFKAIAIGSGTGTATPTAPIPQPALRSGQTRYASGYSSKMGTAAVGTLWDGVPFLPMEDPVSGTIRIMAYRYGLLLSSSTASTTTPVPGTAYEVLVKIGKATATWNKGAGTLTLSSDTPTCGFKYSTDGTAPTTTYTVPISITETKTVRWYATKTGMVDSTEWQTVVTFGAEGPDNFATVYFSTLPAFTDYSDSIRDVELQFQRKPDWYISPSGTGDGLTPSTPSNAATIIGTAGIAVPGYTYPVIGKAFGYRQITASKSGTANIALVRAGANPASSLMKYSTDGTTFSTYSAAVTPPAPGRFYFKLVRADATDFTRRFIQPWFIGTGTGVQINVVWALAEQTVTLLYEPTPLEAADITLRYSVDGTAPSLPYTVPIQLANPVNAGSFVVGKKYKISVPGNTDFVAHGAADDEVATVFTTITPTRAAAAIVIGKKYKILVVGSTDWTTAGSPDNVVGTEFLATAVPSPAGSGSADAGCGTGVATEADDVIVKIQAIHTARETHDFSTSSGVYDCTTIDPEATSDYDEDHAATFTADATIIAQVHKQPADLVWCSEGTYTNPTGKEYVYFFTTEEIIVRGGYKSDFTERDVHGRKTIFACASFAPDIYGAGINLANIETPGILDGLYGSSESRTVGSFTYTATLFKVSLKSGLGYGSCFNCHAAISAEPGDFANIADSGFNYCNRAFDGAGKFYYCSMTISVDTTNNFSYYAFAGGGTFYHGCSATIDINIDPGLPMSLLLWISSPGNIASIASDCSLDLTVTNGDGSPSNTIYAMGTMLNSEVVASLTAGNGGAGTAINPTGGQPTITASFGNVARGGRAVITAVTGSGGAGYEDPGNPNLGGNSICAIYTASTSTPDVSRNDIEVSCTAGSGGGGTGGGADDFSSATHTVNLGYKSLLDSTVVCGGGSTSTSAVATSTVPTYFDSLDDIQISESGGTQGINPRHVNNDAPGGIWGWYSGTPNGDGAPLLGYETPQGTGIALGRYWE